MPPELDPPAPSLPVMGGFVSLGLGSTHCSPLSFVCVGSSVGELDQKQVGMGKGLNWPFSYQNNRISEEEIYGGI